VAAFGSNTVPLTLPESGTFRLVVQLQANVSAGPYSIETWIWSTHDATFRGPRLSLDVTPTMLFDGTVQLNPRMSIQPIVAPDDMPAAAPHVELSHSGALP
jgi:hypothetical protein